MYIHVYIYICTYMYIYIHMHTHLGRYLYTNEKTGRMQTHVEKQVGAAYIHVLHIWVYIYMCRHV